MQNSYRFFHWDECAGRNKTLMANTYFTFKQFTIHQANCAMKVCTDACLFGAWAATQLQNQVAEPFKVLDIGTGTGLLTLMLAQQLNQCHIDAVEIEKQAAGQAAENIQASLWANQIQVWQNTIQDFAKNKAPHCYNTIICNPPFYENDLKSNSNSRNLALHSHALDFAELLHITAKLLAKDGVFFILIPFARTNELLEIAATNKLYVQQFIGVKQTPKHGYFRAMIQFGFTKPNAPADEQSITIKNTDNTYTTDFIQLLQPYYLYL